MAGVFDLYETQMSEQEDQARVIQARDSVRQNMRQDELQAFTEARAATAAAAEAAKVRQPQLAKVTPKAKAKPSLPSFIQAAGVKRAHAAPAAAASAVVDTPAAAASAATPAAAPPAASAESTGAPSAAAPPAKAAKTSTDGAPASAIASLLGYSDSDDEDDGD